MGAANLNKMVEKNRDLLEEENIGNVLELEEENIGKSFGWLARVEGVIGLETLWYRFMIRTGTNAVKTPCSGGRWRPFGTGSLYEPVPKAARAGPPLQRPFGTGS